jgi:stage IV sporulation protein B
MTSGAYRMKRTTIKKLTGITLAIIFLAFNYSHFVQNISDFPSELQIFEGETQVLDFRLPLKISVKGENINVLKFNGTSLKDQEIYNMKDPLSIEPQSQGNISLNLKLLGIIPIKQINVSVTSQKSLIPGGNSIGVSLYTKGALVVGTSEVVDRLGIAHYPAMEAGLLPGDVIESVNGITVNDANHLSQLINKAKGKGVDLECRRGNHLFITSIEPVKDANDDKYRLGLWVRDSTAGVGTLTFYDPQTRYFGALGHAITDVDTGALLMVKGGEIMQSQIMDIKIGKIYRLSDNFLFSFGIVQSIIYKIMKYIHQVLGRFLHKTLNCFGLKEFCFADFFSITIKGTVGNLQHIIFINTVKC